MMEEVQALLEQYRVWLRDKTTLRQVDEWIEITTPYLDRHNDCLQIYAKRADGGFVLTDDGYIIEDLEQSGCRIDSGRRRALLDTTLKGFGVQINKTALEVRASSDNFALRKHNLVQAMLAVNDLFAQSAAFSWIDTREVRAPDSRAYAILNDSDRPVSASVLGAMRSYDVQPVPRSDREGAREELAA